MSSNICSLSTSQKDAGKPGEYDIISAFLDSQSIPAAKRAKIGGQLRLLVECGLAVEDAVVLIGRFG